jgi:plastocyanin
VGARRFLIHISRVVAVMAVLGLAFPVGTSYAATNITIQNFVFNPASVSVPAGTTVTWTNRDRDPHTVTTDTPGGPSSGQLQQGQSYNFTFNNTGTFNYHCSIHPQMKASVSVTQASGTAPGVPKATAPPVAPHSPAAGGHATPSAPSRSSGLPATGSADGPILLFLSSAVTVVYELNRRIKRKP